MTYYYVNYIDHDDGHSYSTGFDKWDTAIDFACWVQSEARFQFIGLLSAVAPIK